MSYQRKGGKGLKGSYRQQFNYYKRQLQKRLIYEQAFKYARTKSLPDMKNESLFYEQNLDFDKVFNEGITRKRGNVTIRYTGIEAIEIQINSLRQRASKTYQRQAYIDNYLQSMYFAGYEIEDIEEVENLFNSVSSDALTYMVDKAILPSIHYIYGSSKKQETMQSIRDALTNKSVRKEAREIAREGRRIQPILTELVEKTGM